MLEAYAGAFEDPDRCMERLYGLAQRQRWSEDDVPWATLSFDDVPDPIRTGVADLLTQVLTYHVVSGKVTAKQVATLNGKAVATVQGSKWTVRVRPSGIYLDNPWGYAMVTKTDINASNGVIHVIDQVLVQAEQITMKERAILKDIDDGIAMPALARALFGRGG